MFLPYCAAPGRSCPSDRIRGEVVGCHGEHKHLIDFLRSPYHRLRHVANSLGPAEIVLDEFSLLLRDAVTFRVGELAVDNAVPF